MAKNIYEVRGTVTIDVIKRVKANDPFEAMELANQCFEGLSTEWNGNSVFVSGEGEELEANYDYYPEWSSAEETDNDDFDSATDDEEDDECEEDE